MDIKVQDSRRTKNQFNSYYVTFKDPNLSIDIHTIICYTQLWGKIIDTRQKTITRTRTSKNFKTGEAIQTTFLWRISEVKKIGHLQV